MFISLLGKKHYRTNYSEPHVRNNHSIMVNDSILKIIKMSKSTTNADWNKRNSSRRLFTRDWPSYERLRQCIVHLWCFSFVCRVFDSICGCMSVFELVSSVKASKQYSWMLHRCMNECKRKSDQSELHRTSCRIE